MTNSELTGGLRPDDEPIAGIDPIEASDLEAIGAAEPNSLDAIPLDAGPDDDPPLGPLTLKEAYGEAIGSLLAWSESAQVTSVRSSDSADDAFVDAGGNCPAWSFSFVNTAGETYDLDVINGQAVPSPYPAEETGAPFQLEDLADSPDLIARAGLAGDQFILRLARDAAGSLHANIQSLESLKQVSVDPAL